MISQMLVSGFRDCLHFLFFQTCVHLLVGSLYSFFLSVSEQSLYEIEHPVPLFTIRTSQNEAVSTRKQSNRPTLTIF